MNRSRLTRALSTTLAVVVLSAMVLAGRSFIWCASMGQAMDACCCQVAADAHSSHGPTLRERSCCEAKALAKTQTSQAASATALALTPPTLLELWVPVRVDDAPLPIEVRPSWLRAHSVAQPRGPPHRLNCVYLI